MGTVMKFLWAKTGSLSLPGKTIPFWGFSTFQRDPQVPGPIVEAKAGDKIIIGLFNSFYNSSPIQEPVSIIFPGQENVKVNELEHFWRRFMLYFYTQNDRYLSRLALRGSVPVKPQYSEDLMVSLTNYLEPTNYYNLKSIVYNFDAVNPGIYLYESGTNCEKQIQMGLYGVIVIRPIGYDTPGHPNYKTAYGVDTGSEYDVEKILVLGEFDSNMHNNVDSGYYDDMLKFKPDCWVINGRSYPDTLNEDNSSSQPYSSKISCRAGERVLLRIINAGFYTHTLYLGGLLGRVIAEDNFPLKQSGMDATYEKAGFTLGAGQSVDIIVTPTIPGEFYLYAREYNHLVNNEEFPGGMMTKLEVY